MDDTVKNISDESIPLESSIDSKSLPEAKISTLSKNISKKLPEVLIKNESDIGTLIDILKKKYKMTEKTLERWRDDISFELRDNTDYWKKDRESMIEADFLEYKQKFEATGVPTTPYKNKLKERSLALIAYG
ncbi:13408_t:CDS:2 [Entrophospora sp. SA101]|nr:13408_t:CDS:2 [Entrophospora sp. SA101]